MSVDLRAELLEDATDDRRAGRAIDVVVTEHGDALAGAHCARQAIGRQIRDRPSLRRRQIRQTRCEEAARAQLVNPRCNKICAVAGESSRALQVRWGRLRIPPAGSTAESSRVLRHGAQLSTSARSCHGPRCYSALAETRRSITSVAAPPRDRRIRADQEADRQRKTMSRISGVPQKKKPSTEIHRHARVITVTATSPMC